MRQVIALLVACFAAAPVEKSPNVVAWDDLRWAMTAIEAYSTDNDGLFAPADTPHEGTLADLDHQYEWYFNNTFPKRSSPHVDPWGHPYRFVISDSRKLYALYSLGADGKLDPAAEDFLKRLRKDQLREGELSKRHSSSSLVVAFGDAAVVFGPPDVLKGLAPVAAAGRG